MAICRKNSPLYFEEYLEIFLGILNIYVFIALNFAEPWLRPLHYTAGSSINVGYSVLEDTTTATASRMVPLQPPSDKILFLPAEQRPHSRCLAF